MEDTADNFCTKHTTEQTSSTNNENSSYTPPSDVTESEINLFLAIFFKWDMTLLELIGQP